VKHMKLISGKHLKVYGGAIWEKASRSFTASPITNRSPGCLIFVEGPADCLSYRNRAVDPADRRAKFFSPKRVETVLEARSDGGTIGGIVNYERCEIPC
jgi:hypothetical protein